MNNQTIKCSVQQCKYNEKSSYCTLNSIQVGTHEKNPTKIECTDCDSFVLR